MEIIVILFFLSFILPLVILALAVMFWVAAFLIDLGIALYNFIEAFIEVWK